MQPYTDQLIHRSVLPRWVDRPYRHDRSKDSHGFDDPLPFQDNASLHQITKINYSLICAIPDGVEGS